MSCSTEPLVKAECKLRVCCGCLETDGGLFDVRERLLQQAFEDLTGLAIYSGFLCSVCLYLLRKFHKFRERCLNTAAILKKFQLSDEDILCSQDRTHLKPNLMKTKTLLICCSSGVKDFVSTEEVKNDFSVHNHPVAKTTTTNLQIDIAEIIKKNFEKTYLNFDILKSRLQTDTYNTIDNKEDINKANVNSTNKNTLKEILLAKPDDNNTNNETNNDDDVDDMLEDSSWFENDKTETTVSSLDNDGLEFEKEVSVTNKRTRMSLSEKKMNDEMNSLMRIMRERVSRNKGDIYKLFERIYVESLNKERTITDHSNVKNKDRCELDNIRRFLDLHKQAADHFNINVEFISIEGQRQDMERQRRAAGAGQCPQCCKKFITAATLARHVKRAHDESVPFRCLVCLYSFKKQAHYRIHLLKMHTMRKTCKECGQNIRVTSIKSYWEEVHTHMGTHRDHAVNCEYCGRTFTLEKYYFLHLRSVHRARINSVQCLLCGDSYNGPSGLRLHLAKMHERAAKCESCSVWFAGAAALAAHAPCRGDLSGCPLCGRAFATERLMKEHYDDAHALYRCSKCVLTFVDLHSYQEHQLKSCSSNDKLLLGDKPTREIKTFVCNVCGRYKKSAAHLRYHQRIHTGEKPYQCDHCGKAFSGRSAILTHMLTHTDERRYKCELCSKAFRLAQHLKVHMTSHTQERNYSCHMCSKRYFSAPALRFHIRTVHEGIPPAPRKRRRKNPTQ